MSKPNNAARAKRCCTFELNLFTQFELFYKCSYHSETITADPTVYGVCPGQTRVLNLLLRLCLQLLAASSVGSSEQLCWGKKFDFSA